jgi:hypothetical protein
MNWTDFFFGALAGILFTILVAGVFAYRTMRPYLTSAAVAAKARRAKGDAATSPGAWPPFSTGGNS